MRLLLLGSLLLLITGIAPTRADEPKAGPLPLAQRGEAIVACGQKIPIGTPVILWTDPGGFDAYAPNYEPSTTPDAPKKARPPGFGTRRNSLTPEQQDEIQRTGWTLPMLQETVDQFVIHYDVCGTSQRCFRVLNERTPPLSVHFMLDLDGTIYQSVDLKENAYHATKANSRSIGIEIANMGAYPSDDLEKSPLLKWYAKGDQGRTEIRLPAGAAVPTLAPGAGPLEPSRPEPVVGMVQGQKLAMYDLTPQQYTALAKLTAGLCKTFPKIRPDLPRDANGHVLDHKLDDPAYNVYQGILGHFHVQQNKTDPGPAFQWDRIVPARKP